jgi:DNA-binding response OmpR family regulator
MNHIELSRNEAHILELLIKRNGAIVSRDEIMNELWQTDEFIDDNTLTVNINRLRKKLEEIGAHDQIRTKRGQGYSL